MTEKEKLTKQLRKLELAAEKNPKAKVRIDRLAKKYDSTLKKLANLVISEDPVGVRRYEA